MTYFLLFILGLAVGSFLNVVVYREVNEVKEEEKEGWPNKIGDWLPHWVWRRSFCDHCKKKLPWYDNVPVLSFLWLRGKCRVCKKPISFQYPFVELLTAVQFVWIYWLLSRFSFFGQVEGFYSFALAGYWLFLFSISLAIAIIDLRTKIIPDIILIPSFFIVLVRLMLSDQWQFLLSGLILGLFFLSLYVVTRGKGLGFGDVKLALFVGVVLGWWQRILVAVFLAFLAGAVVGIMVVLLRKKTLKSAIPFGPFLLLGMWVAKIWGDALWLWYWGLIDTLK